MALHDGVYNSSSYPAYSYWTVEENEQSILSWYSSCTAYRFEGVEDFRRLCEARERCAIDGSKNQYVVFTGVTVETMRSIDLLQESLPRMHRLYDAMEELLIVKLMPGVIHECAVVLFHGIFRDRLTHAGLRREVACSGTGRFGSPSRRCKEPDQAYKPIGTRPAVDEWPSFVVEAGYLESMRQLHSDARFWLTRTDLKMKIALLIHINRITRQLEIKRWETTYPRQGPVTQQYVPAVACIQSITLEQGTIYRGRSLELPVDKVFDVVPLGLPPGGLDLTASQLQDWSEEFWNAIR